MSSAANTTSLVRRWAVYVLLALLASNGNTVSAQSASTIAAYPCPSGAVQSTAELLRNEFGATADVRIAADQRTSQVIVYAPPEVHARISQRLAILSAPAGMTAAAGSSQPPTPNAIARGGLPSGTIPLQHCTAGQLETSLVKVLGNRLQAFPSPRPQVRRYRVVSKTGENTELTIDPALNLVTLEGPDAAVETCRRLIRALDSLDEVGGQNTRLVPLQASRPASIHRAIAVLHETTESQEPREPMVAKLFQPKDRGAQPEPGKTGMPAPANAQKTPGRAPRVGLVNPVEILPLEGLDTLVLRGKAQDVEQVIEVIKEIERISAETEPAIQVLPMRHVDCQAMVRVVQKLYTDVYEPRQGAVNITALVKPNALLAVGRPENVQTVTDLVEKLDQPVTPETQFRVFQLSHAAAGDVQKTIQEFYKDRGGLGTEVRVSVDARSNALLIQAGPRDMEELAALIARIDTSNAQSVNELRIIQLEHSFATDLASILQSAIGAATGSVQSSSSGGPPAGTNRPSQTPSASQGEQQRTAMLRFLTIDTRGKRLIQSGILSNVKITPDTRGNAVVVSAPAECMELIEALIHQLDTLPASVAEIKVFTIVNSDATSLSTMLQSLFNSQTSGSGQQQTNRPATAPAGAESSLVGLRFAVDARTNSIIASGGTAELSVVEAILTRLDDSGVRDRKNFVFRLKNSYAKDVATAVDQFLTKQRQMQQQTPGMTNAFEQIEREVVVVPETGSNSLILSATPRFFEEVKALVEQLDVRPPMVMIQVLIARVDLDNTDEFGIEVGLQDGLLFDRSILSNIQYKTTTVTNPNQTTQTTQTIVAADNTPGYNFNSTSSLGNSGASNSTTSASQVAGQGLTNFGVGRSGKSGVGGLVLSASSESVSALLRALSENKRLEVLQRPQIMTLDVQPAYIQVGEQVPVIKTMTTNQYGQNFNTDMMDVGVLLGVTPRISPGDGLIVMELDVSRSEVGSEENGTPVAVSEGQIIRSPRIERTYAQTTVSAMSGQTVILGGLIAKTKDELHRKVPLLGDIPLLGRLFRYDSVTCSKTELLIILTPHIVRNEAEADAVKQAEAARMSWCLSDVVKLHGDSGLRGRRDNWTDAETQVIYPDMKSGNSHDSKPPIPEMLPTPEGDPAEKPNK
jgi:general secretion pathway protein D